MREILLHSPTIGPKRTAMQTARICGWTLAMAVLSCTWPALAQKPNGAPGQKRPLTTALTGKFPPFSYYDQNGALAGFDVDVSREIARRLGRRPRIVTIEWDGILAGLLAGKYDAIVGSMAITEERAKQVLFSDPYYESGAQLFVHRDNPDKIYGIAECGGLKVGTVLGETYQHYLDQHHPGIEVTTFKSSVEYFEMLDQKRISGFVTDRLVGAWQVKQANRPFVPVGDMLYRERIAIPVRKEDAKLLKQINRALAQMHRDGTMARIRAKYFGLHATSQEDDSEGFSSGTAFRKLSKGFAVTLGIAAASLTFGFLLAIPCALLLTYRNGIMAPLHTAARTLVDFLRGTPVLIQLFFVWLGLGLPPYRAAVLTLGINAMAYMAEVIRAGLMSVPPGQALAAKALGLNWLQRFRHVIWPQAFRIAVPPLMNSVVALIKDTALVAVISIPEVIREAQSIISITFQPRKYYLIIAVMFFVVTFPLMKMAGLLERRMKQKGYADA